MSEIIRNLVVQGAITVLVAVLVSTAAFSFALYLRNAFARLMRSRGGAGAVLVASLVACATIYGGSKSSSPGSGTGTNTNSTASVTNEDVTVIGSGSNTNTFITIVVDGSHSTTNRELHLDNSTTNTTTTITIDGATTNTVETVDIGGGVTNITTVTTTGGGTNTVSETTISGDVTNTYNEVSYTVGSSNVTVSVATNITGSATHVVEVERVDDGTTVTTTTTTDGGEPEVVEEASSGSDDDDDDDDEEVEVLEPWTSTKAVTIKGALRYDGGYAGIIQFKIAKPVTKKKTGEKTAKISGYVMTLDGKKRQMKATKAKVPSDAPITVAIPVNNLGSLSLTVGNDNFTGSIGGYTVVNVTSVGGALNVRDAAAYVDFGDLIPYGVEEDLLPSVDRPESFTALSKRWKFPTAAQIKYKKGLIYGDDNAKRPNLSAMKLTYTSSTGVFKGSFKIYTVVNSKFKKYTVKVSGVVVNGEGYGQAALSKLGMVWRSFSAGTPPAESEDDDTDSEE